MEQPQAYPSYEEQQLHLQGIIRKYQDTPGFSEEKMTQVWSDVSTILADQQTAVEERLAVQIKLEEARNQRLLRENQRQQALLKAIFEADPAGLAVFAGVELRLVYCNPAYHFISPHNGFDQVGQTYESIWAEDVNCDPDAIRQVVETGRPYQTLDFKRNFTDGTRRNFTLQARRIEWDDRPAALIALWDTTELKRTGEYLAFQADLLENVHDAIFATDERLRITFWNRAAEELYGWSSVEALGKHAAQVVRSELTIGQWEQARIQMEQDGYYRGEIVHHTREGRRLVVESLYKPQKDTFGHTIGYINAIRDVTERKNAEERVRLSEEKFSKAFSANAAAIVISRMADGKIIDVNETWRKMFGFQGEEVNGTSISLNLWPDPEDRPRIVQVLRENGSIRDCEQILLRRSGEPFLALGSADVMSLGGEEVILSTWLDISDRKSAEEALRASEEWFRTTLGSIGDAVITTDQDARVTFLNPVAEQLTGWSNLEADGQPMQDVFNIVNEQTYQPAVSPVEKVIQSGEVVGLANHTALISRNGPVTPIEDSAAPILDRAGQTVGVVMVFHDVTQKRTEEQERNRLNRTLKALAHSNQAMVHWEDEPAYLNAVCRIVTEDCGHTMAWIGFAEENAEKSVQPVAHAGLEAGYLERLKITWADTERGRGPVGTAIRTGRVTVCRDVLTDPQFEPWRADAIKRGYGALISLPLSEHGKVFGALTIYARDPKAFSEDEVQLLVEMANDLTFGIVSLRARAAQKISERVMRENEQNQARIEVQRRLIEQREQERLQIARELHDGPVQELIGASMNLQGMLLDCDDLPQREAFKSIRTNLQCAIAELRGYAQELRPPVLSKFGLEKAILAHLEAFREKHPDLDLCFAGDQNGELLPVDVRLALYRIYQETLNNVVKHAKATQVKIYLKKTQDEAILEIQDNGTGFELPRDWLEFARQGHLGLVGMRERAEAIGGMMEIRSHPGQGTRIQVTVPLE